MKLYLSSYKIGTEEDYLKEFIQESGNQIAYISNALDFSKVNLEKREATIKDDLKNLEDLGFQVSLLDLKNYFSKKEALTEVLQKYNAVWVCGGNTFILRQAMFLSGFDEILLEELSTRDDFLYAGYSAGCCVLSPELNHLQIVDDPNDFPYSEIKETIWEGLGVIDFALLPHYDSEHPESDDIEKEIKYCIDNKIIFIALRDGEVIIEK
jgi:dipeptidase E